MSYLTHAPADIDLKTLILVFAAIGALYRFVQRGSFHPLLDLRVSARLIQDIDIHRQYLVCSVRAKNIHVPMFKVEYSALLVTSKQEVGPESEPPPTWESRAIELFPTIEEIWADETIRDEKLVTVPTEDHVFDVYFKIVAKLLWYELPLSILSTKFPKLKRLAPKRTSRYARAIVDNHDSTAKVKKMRVIIRAEQAETDEETAKWKKAIKDKKRLTDVKKEDTKTSSTSDKSTVSHPEDK
jgi:hypothetical protein